jgi:hypothetical protein
MWRRNTLSTWLTLTAAIILVSFVTVRRTRAQVGQRVPFTAVVVDTLYKYPSGEYATQLTTKFAIRSDGSNVRIRQEVLADGTTNEIKGLLDVPAKAGMTTDELTHSITTVHYDDASLAKYTTKPGSCAVDSPAESAQILGYTVLKSTREGPKTPDGERRTVRWVAPALDCYALKKTLLIAKAGGPLLPVTLSEVRSIVPGEPDPSLFAIPADRTERAPSEVFAERQMLKNEPQVDCPKCAQRDSTLDSIYRERHNPK